MIRPRSIKRIKRKTPGSKMTIHFKKRKNKPLLKFAPKIKREMLKERVRK